MKLQRLLGITMLLLSRKRVGAQELARRFEVSLRTIYRGILRRLMLPESLLPRLRG